MVYMFAAGTGDLEAGERFKVMECLLSEDKFENFIR